MARKPRDKVRLSYAPVLMLAGFGGAALSQLRVQLFERDAVLQKGIESHRFVVERTERAKRGLIVSADGRQLAAEEEACELVVDFRKVPNSPAFFMDLGAASGRPASEFQQLYAAGVKSRTWQERLSPAQAQRVLAVKAKWRADGISAARLGERYYPLGEAASCLVGYLRDGEPKGGLELALESRLAGEDGMTIGMVDRQGDFLPLRKDPESRPKTDGARIDLTIDSELQLAAASSVRAAVESNKADQGCAVVVDPKTGNVLAMANWPSFDPSYSASAVAPTTPFSDFNPAIMARLEPGSTFKILTLALGLDEHAVTIDEKIDCKGSWKVWPTRDVHCDAHGGRRDHGLIDSVEAIARSCNVSAAHWALDIGYEPFTAFLKQAGLLDKPGVGLPGEIAGGYNEKEYAKRLQLATFGFGQSLTVTPLSLCSAFSMLANGGVRMPPRLVDRIGGKPVPAKEPQRLVSEDSARQVLIAMEQVFTSEHGTGKSLRIPGYRLAGKTGTAEKRDKKTGTVGQGGYVSNFIGFVPAENPKAAILVMIDNPKMGRYYGGTVAGPVFVDIAKSVIRRYGIPRSAPATSEPAKPAAETKASGPTVEIQVARPGRRAASPPYPHSLSATRKGREGEEVDRRP